MLKRLKRVKHWVNANNLPRASTRRKYRLALYWAFTTMTTVGYGDIVIVSNTERFVAMFSMIVGGACFGYIIGGVTSILENLDLSSTMHNEKMDAVKEYLYDRQYPPVLSSQIKKHFKNIFMMEGVFDTMAILETLPVSTAIDLVYTFHRDLIHGTPFLRHSGSNFVISIAPSLFPCTANDGEFILFEGSVGTHLYFINSGIIAISVADLSNLPSDVPSHVSTSCGTRSAGQILGEVAIMLTFTSPFSAYVKHKAGLYSIKKEKLVNALEIHPAINIELLERADGTRRHIRDCLTLKSSQIFPGQIKTPGFGHAIVQGGLLNEKSQVTLGTMSVEISSLKLWRDHRIIHPELPAKMTWDVLICFLIIYSIVAITYTISFGIEEPACALPSNGWMGLSAVSTCSTCSS